MKKRISILGCGWVGLSLGRYLLERGYDVKGSTTSPQKLTGGDPISLRQHQISLPDDLYSASINPFFDCDLLTITLPPNLKEKSGKTSLARYAKGLVTRLEELGVRDVIYLSSTAVYGEVSGTVTEETSPIPSTERAENLLYIENILRSSRSISTTILRCAGLAGYNRDPGKFLAGRSNLPDPELPVNILHRDDCVMIIEKVISMRRGGEIYNLCTDLHPNRKEFYVARALRVGEHPPTFLERGESKNKIISNEKIKSHLDYRFKYPDPMTMP